MQKALTFTMNRKLYDDAIERPSEIMQMEINTLEDVIALNRAIVVCLRTGAISTKQSNVASRRINAAAKTIEKRLRGKL